MTIARIAYPTPLPVVAYPTIHNLEFICGKSGKGFEVPSRVVPVIGDDALWRGPIRVSWLAIRYQNGQA
jgi:hypothetical protein